MRESPLRTRVVAPILLAFVAAGLAIGAEPIEKLSPESTLFLLKVRSGSDLMRKWRTTGYYEFWMHKETRKALGGLSQMIDQPLALASASIGLGDKGLSDLFANQYGVTVCAPPLGEGAGVHVVFLAEAGPLAANVIAAYGEAVKKQTGGANPFEDHAGVKIVQAPGMPVAAAAHKGFLIVATPAQAARGAVDRVKSPPQEPLASSPAFAAISGKMDRNCDVLLYLDAAALVSGLSQSGLLDAKAASALSAIGLDALNAVCATFLIGEEGLHLKVHMSCPGERRGLLKILAPPKPSAGATPSSLLASLMVGAGLSPTDKEMGPPSQVREGLGDLVSSRDEGRRAETAPAEPKARDQERKSETPATAAPAPGMAEGGKVTAAVHLGETIPSDAAQFASYRIRPAEAWQGALEVLAAFDASAVGAIREQADAIAAKAGKKDAVEMLQLLGERVVTYVRYAKPFTKEDSEQTVVFVEIRQRDAVEAALAKLRKQHSQVFAPAETGKSAGVLLYQTSLPGVGKPLTYCVTDRYLIAGLSRAAVMDYLTRSVGGSESIHRQAEFQAVMQQLPPDESRIMGQYNNPSPMVQWALTNLRAGKFDSGATPTDPMLGMVLQSLRQVSNPNVIAGLLPVNGMAVSSDPEGIRFTMFHTLRGPGQ